MIPKLSSRQLLIIAIICAMLALIGEVTTFIASSEFPSTLRIIVWKTARYVGPLSMALAAGSCVVRHLEEPIHTEVQSRISHTA